MCFEKNDVEEKGSFDQKSHSKESKPNFENLISFFFSFFFYHILTKIPS